MASGEDMAGSPLMQCPDGIGVSALWDPAGTFGLGEFVGGAAVTKTAGKIKTPPTIFLS